MTRPEPATDDIGRDIVGHWCEHWATQLTPAETRSLEWRINSAIADAITASRRQAKEEDAKGIDESSRSNLVSDAWVGGPYEIGERFVADLYGQAKFRELNGAWLASRIGDLLRQRDVLHAQTIRSSINHPGEKE